MRDGSGVDVFVETPTHFTVFTGKLREGGCEFGIARREEELTRTVEEETRNSSRSDPLCSPHSFIMR